MITTILNVYRRPQNLEEQIAAIRGQTVESKIWVWVNHHEDNADFSFDGLDVDRVVRSDHNFKYHGRFALALLCDTEFVAFFDDDTIPGKLWYKNCLSTMATHSGILGGAGVTLNTPVYDIPGYTWQHERVGWPSQNEEIQQTDLVGHAWFMKRWHVNYLWRGIPFTLENAEDIQLSYLAQRYGGIKTYCPPHPADNKDMWSSLKAEELGDDPVASSNARLPGFDYFCNLRNACVKDALDNGWRTVNNVGDSVRN
jgi:hypothetical protein